MLILLDIMQVGTVVILIVAPFFNKSAKGYKAPHILGADGE